MTKSKEIENWLEHEFNIEGSLTNWHLNDQFLDFHDTFFHDESFLKSRKKFTYYANKLVAKGILKKAKRIGIGSGGIYEFGSRTQTIWHGAKIDKTIGVVTYDTQGRISKIRGKFYGEYSSEKLEQMKKDGIF